MAVLAPSEVKGSMSCMSQPQEACSLQSREVWQVAQSKEQETLLGIGNEGQ